MLTNEEKLAFKAKADDTVDPALTERQKINTMAGLMASINRYVRNSLFLLCVHAFENFQILFQKLVILLNYEKDSINYNNF